MTLYKTQFLSQLAVVCGIVFLILFFTTSFCSAQILDPQQTYGHVQLTQLQNSTDNLTYTWDTTLDTPRYLRFQNLNIQWQSTDDVKKSYQFLATYKQLYKINNPFNEFRLVTQQTDSIGMTFVVLQQYVNDVPVNDARLTFHFKPDGSLSSVQGTYIPNLLALPTKPKLTPDQAVLTVKKKFQLGQSEKPNSVKLVVHDEAVFGTQSAQASLIWVVSIGDYSYYVDAQTGEVIKKYSDISNAYDEETYVESSCDTVDTLTYDENGLFGSAVDDADAAALHDEVQNSYNYFNDSTKFNISSTTLDSTVFLNPISSYTHYMTPTVDPPDSINCTDTFDAAWRNTYDYMYFAQGVYGQDIVGHELTHGVIHHTVALDYTSDIPAALNESYADIFGTLIQYYSTGIPDWIIGENLSSTRSGCSRGLRDLSDPPSLTGYCDSTTGSAQPNDVADLGGDYSDEHAASNIPSYAFYLLAEGGIHPDSGDIVTGIGIDDAEQIYIRVIKDYYLSSNATFEDAYDATMAACLDLSEYDSASYPITDCEAVHDAFYAVGITTDSSYISPYISTSSDTGTPPTTISFDGSGSVAIASTITSYNWDFGDGSTDTGATVSHTYSDPGTYNVTLTVANVDGYSTTEHHTITMYVASSIGTTTWTTDHSPYIVNGMATISGTDTLTIDPGVVVKFMDTTSGITVDGGLQAVATSVDPIIFTSYKDDSYGGDSNGDDTTTTPAAGDWYYIRTNGSGTTNFKNVTIQYGGYDDGTGDPYGMVWADDSATLSVRHSTLQDSEYYTLQTHVSSTTSAINSTITNSTDSRDAVYVEDGTVTLRHNTIQGNTTSGYGVYVAGGSLRMVSNSVEGYYGIMNGSNSFELSDNTIDNSYVAIWDFELSTITGNTITNSEYGIFASGTTSTISYNTISDTNYGIVVGSSATPTVAGNIITGAIYGIFSSAFYNYTISHNFINSSTSYGLINSEPDMVTMDTENNWWGDASGPYNSTTNPGGTGDTVSDYVDFSPWSTDSTPPTDPTITLVRKNAWDKTITLTWTNSADADFDHVEITRTDPVGGTVTLTSSETGTTYTDTGLQYGRGYTYTISTVDTSGNTSRGVSTGTKIMHNPRPTSLSLTAGDTAITAAWTASSAPAASIDTYKIYYGTAPTAMTNVLDVGNVTSATITGLTNGTQYFVNVIVYNTSGVASPRSTIKASRPHA